MTALEAPFVNQMCAHHHIDPIPPDPHGPLTITRFRRTLAWFIRRQPRGLIAASIQYGHVHTGMIQGYRLIEGKPLRSTGRLNTSQLAIEAGVPRWHLTHQHVDLKEMFLARVQSEGKTPAPFRDTAAALDDLQRAYRALQQRCAQLEEQNKTYANVIQVLATERATDAHIRPVSDIASQRAASRQPPAGHVV